MNNISLEHIAGMIDISAVRADVSTNEIDEMAALAVRHRFAAAYALPCFTKRLGDKLTGCPEVHLGGVVSFPSGASSITVKVKEACELIELGCNEIDMVINIGALKSGMFYYVADDIAAVVEAAGSCPVKAIIEVACLTRDEIVRASEIAVSSGAKYVKTGTGWSSKPTTIDDVHLIKRTIGNSAKLKVAGGVRSLDMMLEMIIAGCSRFGISYESSVLIMREVEKRISMKENLGHK